MVRIFLKRIVPMWLRFFARAVLKNWRVLAGGHVPGSRLLNAVAVACAEQREVIGLLDYPHREIRLSVHSHRELRRLEACAKEPETVRWIETHIRPGDVFYDVGANVGAYSLLAWALSGGRVDIFSFEPVGSTYASLCRNIILNGCAARVRVLPVALGAETACVPLYLSSMSAGAASHSLSKPDVAERSRAVALQHVLMYRLDDCVAEFALPEPTLLKIDVDGGELGVVGGASDTLRSSALRSIIIEIDYRLAAAREIVRGIERAGFRLVGEFPRMRRELRNVVFERH